MEIKFPQPLHKKNMKTYRQKKIKMETKNKKTERTELETSPDYIFNLKKNHQF